MSLRFRERLQRIALESLQAQRDSVAVQHLEHLQQAFLPWTASAMRPAGMLAVVNEVLINQRQVAVEFGGGISTYFLGAIAQETSATILTIEHDRSWSERLCALVKAWGFDSHVSVVHAPIRRMDDQVKALHADWLDTDWYDMHVVRQSLALVPPVDLLVVDGPPAFERERRFARYPALPAIAPHLADDYTVILDDIHRPGERSILRSWSREWALESERRLLGGSIGILRSRPTGFYV